MPKSGMGHNWVLTDKRKDTAIAHFKSQGSLTSLAVQFGIHKSTLSTHIKKHNIPYKELQASGIHQLRRKMFNLIDDLEPADRHKAGMKFLERYEKLEDDVEIDTTNTDAIRDEILRDLNV